VCSATFNNFSAITLRSFLLVGGTGIPGENHRPTASHRQYVSHNVVHLALFSINLNKLNISASISLRRVHFSKLNNNFTFPWQHIQLLQITHIFIVSFIGGGNRNTRRKPPTYRKSQTICIT
jgi:hypothetical protein